VGLLEYVPCEAFMQVTIRPHCRFPIQRSVSYNSSLWLLIAVLLLGVGPAYGDWTWASANNQVGLTIYMEKGGSHAHPLPSRLVP